MKSLLFFSLLFATCTLYSQNYYRIEDDFGRESSYEVTSQFLDELADYIQRNASPYSDNSFCRPFLFDIYNAFRNGRTLTYYPDRNAIGGMLDSDWTSLSSKDLNRFRKHPNGTEFDTLFMTKKFRFNYSIGIFGQFHPSR